MSFKFLVLLALAACVHSLELEAINCKVLAKKLKINNINQLYLPHEEDCTVFYHCGLGGAVLQPCGEGTIFSLRNKDCRRPEDTKCILLEQFLEKKRVKLEDFYEEDY